MEEAEKIFLGDLLKEYRKRSGLTQLDLEISIRAANGSISKIEKNKINPTKETLLKIANTLDLSKEEKMKLFNI